MLFTPANNTASWRMGSCDTQLHKGCLVLTKKKGSYESFLFCYKSCPQFGQWNELQRVDVKAFCFVHGLGMIHISFHKT